MSMSVDPEFRKRLIAGALQTVEVNARIRGWYHQADEGHRFKTGEFDEMSSEGLERSIRKAMDYGYPIEAVAVAASMSVDEVRAIAEGSAAA